MVFKLFTIEEDEDYNNFSLEQIRDIIIEYYTQQTNYYIFVKAPNVYQVVDEDLIVTNNYRVGIELLSNGEPVEHIDFWNFGNDFKRAKELFNHLTSDKETAVYLKNTSKGGKIIKSKGYK